MKRNHGDDKIDLGGVEQLDKALRREKDNPTAPEPEEQKDTTDLESHRTASEMDHPRGSVRMKHFDKQTRDAIQRILESLAEGNAEDIALVDAAGRYTATDVEAALTEIAGAGRTTETVKDNADDIATNTANITANTNDIASYRDVHTVTSANYTILDDDDYAVILVTTGAVDRTITLPTVADNSERQIKIVKVDSGVGKVIVDGEGAETINGTTTWEITEQYGHLAIVSNGSTWFVTAQMGSIYSVTNSTNYNLTTSWVDYYSLSGLTAGKYLIEFGVGLNAGSSDIAYATIASAVDVEQDREYSVYHYDVTGYVFLSKSFIRSFAVGTTLYLNAKGNNVGPTIYQSTPYSKGYIRAIRIG